MDNSLVSLCSVMDTLASILHYGVCILNILVNLNIKWTHWHSWGCPTCWCKINILFNACRAQQYQLQLIPCRVIFVFLITVLHNLFMQIGNFFFKVRMMEKIFKDTSYKVTNSYSKTTVHLSNHADKSSKCM